MVRSEAAAAAARAKDLTAAAAKAAALADPNDKELLRERSEGGKKKMPTIFKYSGKEAKEVYVAGQTELGAEHFLLGRAATWRRGFVNNFLRVPQLYCCCSAA